MRSDFPILKKVAYLDNAATTQKPIQVIEAVKEFYTDSCANIHRGVYSLSEEATNKYEDARKKVAGFIKAEDDEVIFTKGTTESLNLLSYCLYPMIKGDEIVLTELEHHANIVPWQQMAKRHNLRIKYIKLKDDFTLDYEDAKSKITVKTAIVSFAHVSNAIGTINDVKMLCNLAKQNNAISIVDAAQSALCYPIDVKALGCDFLAFSGHKMFAPTGIGVLYGKVELLNKMPPFNTGGDMIKHVSFEDAEFQGSPLRFEAGTPNIAGAIGLGVAVDYISSHSHDICENCGGLRKYCIDSLNKLGDINLYCPENGASIISFNIGKAHPHDVASLLNDHDVCVRAGHHCAMPLMGKLGVPGTVRVSLACYNNKEDIDRLIEGLKHVKEIFK
ncbi:cysteine desulfurase [Candidatus Woesearchaeota archaeon]|nr:cysteine desulfurase [Candidatus Woesearchaeota archaeon]